MPTLDDIDFDEPDWNDGRRHFRVTRKKPVICQMCFDRQKYPKCIPTCRNQFYNMIPPLNGKRVLEADMNMDVDLDRDLAQEYLDEMEWILLNARVEFVAGLYRFKHGVSRFITRVGNLWYNTRVRVEDWWDAAWKPSIPGMINVFAVIAVLVLILNVIFFG